MQLHSALFWWIPTTLLLLFSSFSSHSTQFDPEIELQLSQLCTNLKCFEWLCHSRIFINSSPINSSEHDSIGFHGLRRHLIYVVFFFPVLCTCPLIKVIFCLFQLPGDPSNVAFIKYTPSDENPHADFADEIYAPPPSEVLDRQPFEGNFILIFRAKMSFVFA